MQQPSRLIAWWFLLLYALAPNHILRRPTIIINPKTKKKKKKSWNEDDDEEKIETLRKRIINVSSRAHHFGVIHWKDVNFYKQSYDGYKAYAQSKLAMVMHAKELATRLQESGVNVFSVNPGETDTNLNRRMSWSRWWSWVYALKLHKLFVKSAHFGAQTTIFCAIDHSLDGAFCSGRYYSNCREARPSGHSTLAKNCKKLWDLSQHYCGLSQRATAAAGTHATSPHRHHHTPTAAAHPHTPTKHPQSPIVSSPQTPNDYEVISNKANTSQSELL